MTHSRLSQTATITHDLQKCHYPLCHGELRTCWMQEVLTQPVHDGSIPIVTTQVIIATCSAPAAEAAAGSGGGQADSQQPHWRRTGRLRAAGCLKKQPRALLLIVSKTFHRGGVTCAEHFNCAVANF
jgi:hypothetical protein